MQTLVKLSQVRAQATTKPTRLQYNVKTRLTAALARDSKCAAIRETVAAFPCIERVEFVAIATSMGINRFTANTQYQHVRNELSGGKQVA